MTGQCVQWVLWSAERVVPMTILTAGDKGAGLVNGEANESAETFVRCVNGAQAGCAAALGCLSERKNVSCEEAGCSLKGGRFEASCQGDVATLSAQCGPPTTRDCARVGGKCDPTSPTGCNDRHPTSCASAQNRADRCDGAVRLGCDGKDRVSFRDCSRLAGGSCQTGSDGVGECSFVPAGQAPCGGLRDVGQAVCKPGGKVEMCIYGALAQAAAPAELCPP